jgi:uroporphyrinogen decarboxylase
MTTKLDQSPFLRACRREPLVSPPVWLMRQAGRYMKEYREIRDRVPFLEMCKTPDLVAEVTDYAARRLGVDAAIVFSDLLLPVEAFGLQLTYEKSDGPAIHPPVREAKDIDQLREPELEADLGYVFEGVRRTRRALPPDLPLIGFAGAPFTLASYMIEGGGSSSYRHTKSLFYRDPGAWNALMERIVRLTAAYLNAQAAAGAQAVQIFDSWVGCLSPDDFGAFVLPHVKRLVAALTPGVPVIYFGTQTGSLLPQLRGVGAGVIGVDWRVDLVGAWDTLGEIAIMGNLDPIVLFAPRDEVVRRTRALLKRGSGRPGWIFNLGHGILPHTPVDNVIALVETVHAWESA